VAFDQVHEMLWVGSTAGTVSVMQSPSLLTVSHLSPFGEPVTALEPLGEVVAVVSASQIRAQRPGGVASFTLRAGAGGAPAGEQFLSCGANRSQGSCYVGTSGGSLLHISARDGDLLGSCNVSTGDAEEGVSAIHHVTGGATLAVGTTAGNVKFFDLRESMSAGPHTSVVAHQGAVTNICSSPKGDVVATTGLFGRFNRSSADRQVTVIDARQKFGTQSFSQSAPLMHPLGAAWAGFLPLMGSTVVMASEQGHVSMTDLLSSQMVAHFQVPAQISCSAVSSSGDCFAFGDARGVVHLWSASEAPTVNAYSQPFSTPAPYAYEGPPMDERTPFTAPPPFSPAAYLQAQGMMGDLYASSHLSDEDLGRPVWVGAAPRVVHDEVRRALHDAPSIAPGVSVTDNPFYAKAKAPGVAAAESLPLRRARAQAAHRLRKKAAHQDPEAAHEREIAYRQLLPSKFRHVEMRLPAAMGKAPFADFDFSFHNRTRFAGLENDAANAYCNPVLQALFYVPQLASLLLSCRPSPDRELSLPDELAFLAHMLRISPPGHPVQAGNLVGTLRQHREAIGLGLLESQGREMSALTGNKGDMEAGASVDRSLLRRVQTLSRFLVQELAEGESTLDAGRVRALFGWEWSHRTTCLKDRRNQRVTQQTSFQLDLSYPDRQALCSEHLPPGGALPGPAGAVPPDAINPEAVPAIRHADRSSVRWHAGKRPSFADVLRGSIVREQTLRAWFNESKGYQPVVQERVPTSLPEVMVVGTGLHEPGHIPFWHPEEGGAGGAPERAWLPDVVEISYDVDSREVSVRQGPDAESLAGPPPRAGARRAVYELTSVVSHVHDPSPPVDGDERAAASLADPSREGHLVAQVRLAPAFVAGRGGTPPSPSPATPGLSPLPWDYQPRGAGPEAGAPATPGGGDGGAGAAGDGGSLETPPAKAGAAAHTMAGRESSFKVAGPPEDALAPGDWLLLNDFAVSRVEAHEAKSLSHGLKLPALLLFSRIGGDEGEGPPLPLARAPQEPVPPAACPVMTEQEFAALCREPSLNAGRPDQLPAKFVPLDVATEAPRPGMLVAIDTEFVQMAPAQCVYRDGTQIVLRPPRLSLARISVLRGDPGEREGLCCIDDHVKRTEPVWDYLTRFSGVQAGDLDAGTSRHHLTTLKKAYLKLRYLVDTGCVFVGHGLRKDFKMINIVVPPAQIVDTVELFHFKHQRKLSLKFLASYLLEMAIQLEVHDSIEDARVALLLYKRYTQLVRDGTFEVTMLEMYRFGKAQGWDPANWASQPNRGGAGETEA